MSNEGHLLDGKLVFLSTIMTATAGVVVFLFLNFETKAEATDRKNEIHEIREQLVRMEQKLDQLSGD